MRKCAIGKIGKPSKTRGYITIATAQRDMTRRRKNKMAIPTLKSLKGSMTHTGCVHFVNMHRDRVGCFGSYSLDIWAEATKEYLRKEGGR